MKVRLNELVRVHVPLGKASHNRTQTYSSELHGQNRQMPIALLLRNYALLSRCPQKLISQNGNTQQAHSWNILHSEFHLQYFSISPISGRESLSLSNSLCFTHRSNSTWIIVFLGRQLFYMAAFNYQK